MAGTLMSRLQLKEGHQVFVMNGPKGYPALLEGISLADEGSGHPEAVLVFVNWRAEVEPWVCKAIQAVPPGGMLWVGYPKMSSGVISDINRDRLWEAVVKIGWRPIRQVALDDTWSALRFKPLEVAGR
jgi:hypothetical protein